MSEQFGQLIWPIGVSLEGLTSAAQANEDLAVIARRIGREWCWIPEKEEKTRNGI